MSNKSTTLKKASTPYDELPLEFRNNWLENWKFEIYYYMNIKSKYYKVDRSVYIYDMEMQNSKDTRYIKLKYNTLLTIYELDIISGETSFSYRYVSYAEMKEGLQRVIDNKHIGMLNISTS